MTKHTIILAIAALTLTLSACTRDSARDKGPAQNVKITFKTGTRTGTPNDGDDQDRYINTLRVLIYDHSTGRLAFNFPAYGLDGTPGTDNEEYSGQLTVRTGKYIFVFVANEHSDPATSARLNAITTGANNTFAHLEDNIAFARAAFDKSRDIPMVKIKDAVVIQGDNKLLDPSMATGANPSGTFTGVWPISMIRLGVRVDLSVYMTADQKLLWQPEGGRYRLYINNIPNEVSLFSGKTYGGSYMADDSYYLEMTTTEMAAVSETTPHTWSRVILPESDFSPVSATTRAMTLGFKDHLYNVRRSGYLGSAPPTDYTLPRNTYRTVTARLNIRTLEFDMEVRPVVDWTDDSIDELEML